MRNSSRTQSAVRPDESQVPRSPAEIADFVYQHGDNYDSYLATEDGREQFWSCSGPGLISYTRCGRHVLVGGGIIAPVDRKAIVLGQFFDFAKSRRYLVSFYNVTNN